MSFGLSNRMFIFARQWFQFKLFMDLNGLSPIKHSQNELDIRVLLKFLVVYMHVIN